MMFLDLKSALNFDGALCMQAGLSASDIDPKSSGLLEKKWTALVRLQKRVVELEAAVAEAADQASAPKKLGDSKDRTCWIPRGPASKSLSGHRMPLTVVKFHPVFSVYATGSEDATIRIYDYEEGSHERTLKGHTNTVQDIDFDTKGDAMASASSDMTVRVSISSFSTFLDFIFATYFSEFLCTHLLNFL